MLQGIIDKSTAYFCLFGLRFNKHVYRAVQQSNVEILFAYVGE